MRRALAVLLSVVAYGLGLAVLGRIRRSCFWLGAGLLALLLLPLVGQPAVWAFCALGMGSVIDTAVVAANDLPARQVIALTLALAVLRIGLRFAVLGLWLQSYEIPSSSMAPALRPGDRLLAWKIVRPRAGEIVTFHLPHDDETTYVKRVIATGGDKVRVRGGVAVVQSGVVALDNDARCPDPSPDQVCRIERAGSRSWATTWKKQGHGGLPPPDFPRDDEWFTVPRGMVFVLGDARDNSKDSRAFGPVALENLTGRVLLRYWASDWSRTGDRL
jgi:signal peptidase I